MKLPSIRNVVRLIKAIPATLSAVATAGWWGVIRESFAGAWQQNVEVDAPSTLLSFSGLFACVTGIAADISKLRIKLIQEVPSGIWVEVLDLSNQFVKVLRKPNHYQTRIQFIAQWVISLLLNGNTYVLKERDARGEVIGLYVLDPQRVTPLIAESGDVYYRLRRDDLSQVPQTKEGIVVPASEIIHDRINCLFHPLVGVSPIYACSMSTTMGNKIIGSSATFFANAARASGVLTAPGEIKDETAVRLKTYWEENFRGVNTGRVAVLGDGLKFEGMTVPAVDAQLIEQLKWTVEDVARTFHYPFYKLGGPAPSYNNVEALTLSYYNDCLQPLIEGIELALDEGFPLPDRYGTELDLDNLLRMDSFTRYERHNKGIGGGWLSPNEVRKLENYPPVKGGEFPMMQQQNWTLGQLAERPAPTDAPSVSPPPRRPALPAPEEKEIVLEELDIAAELFVRGLSEESHVTSI